MIFIFPYAPCVVYLLTFTCICHKFKPRVGKYIYIYHTWSIWDLYPNCFKDCTSGSCFQVVDALQLNAGITWVFCWSPNCCQNCCNSSGGTMSVEGVSWRNKTTSLAILRSWPFWDGENVTLSNGMTSNYRGWKGHALNHPWLLLFLGGARVRVCNECLIVVAGRGWNKHQLERGLKWGFAPRRGIQFILVDGSFPRNHGSGIWEWKLPTLKEGSTGSPNNILSVTYKWWFQTFESKIDSPFNSRFLPVAGETSAPPRIHEAEPFPWRIHGAGRFSPTWMVCFFDFYGIGKRAPWIPKNLRSTEWNWSIYQHLLSLKLTARTCKRMVGRLRLVYLVSFWDGFLAGVMFQGVYPLNYPDV